MKTFRLSIGIIATMAIMTSASAQVAQTLISFRDGSVTQAVATPRLKLHDFLGKKGVDLDVWGFGGVSLDRAKSLTGGLAVSHRFNLAKEAFADLGLYTRAVPGAKADGGLFVGVGLRL